MRNKIYPKLHEITRAASHGFLATTRLSCSLKALTLTCSSNPYTL